MASQTSDALVNRFIRFLNGGEGGNLEVYFFLAAGFDCVLAGNFDDAERPAFRSRLV